MAFSPAAGHAPRRRMPPRFTLVCRGGMRIAAMPTGSHGAEVQKKSTEASASAPVERLRPACFEA